MVDINEVLQAIKEKANAKGYDVVRKNSETPGNPSWITEQKLHIELQQKDRDNRPLLNLDVTFSSNRLRVMYDGLNMPIYAKDLNELRTIINEWLQPEKE